ncbi:hypothetical protein GIB67_042418 [Kingdonia uniflora]|uniref:Uncharacterized protein n=1 Tax=Kingdonia uniflora TaxID=39325 RepID=A0A7J7M884_9MAGN|nr:hypothetical protein GIB67_042418 [Kingdonia uniflora]
MWCFTCSIARPIYNISSWLRDSEDQNYKEDDSSESQEEEEEAVCRMGIREHISQSREINSGIGADNELYIVKYLLKRAFSDKMAANFSDGEKGDQ